jgi:hypothetical protein
MIQQRIVFFIFLILVSQKRVKNRIQAIFMTTKGFDLELLMPIAKTGAYFVLANDKSKEDAHLKNFHPNY